jgi:tetratricopeptide (TPR) repeat protein
MMKLTTDADWRELFSLLIDSHRCDRLGRSLAWVSWGTCQHDYIQAIQLDPKHANARSNRGVVYSMKQDYERAIADFSQAIACAGQAG